MNKRIRKKKHVGEFTEYGVNIRIDCDPGCDSNAVVDAFIAFAEAHDYALGGGVDMDGAGHFFVTGVRPCRRLGPGGVQRYLGRSLTQADRDALHEYLAAAPHISFVEVGSLVDAWS